MADVPALCEQIEALTREEAIRLKQLLEETLYVSTPPSKYVIIADPPPPETVETATYEIVLLESGSRKLHVIKIIREFTDLGMMVVKGIVDNLPRVINTGLTESDAQRMLRYFHEEGAVAELRREVGLKRRS